jgi:serine/threonine-protein kinase
MASSLAGTLDIAETAKFSMSRTFSATLDRASGAEGPAREVGKYRVLAELGRGGMAHVYLAALQGAAAVSKLVVLKALLPEIASEPDSLARFLDEARLAALLNHGNVVQTYEVGAEGDRHVIVMEYLDGQSLASLLRRAEKENQPLPLALHLRALIDVLEGLQYAHELKGYDGKSLQLVHRDISPQNVFVTYDGRVKLLDFGIAKAATSTTHTATGVVKGKIAYMSPEQLFGDDVDQRADVYAFGCMLWAAAAGQRLWKNVADTRIMRLVLEGDIVSPRTINPSCDDALARIVMKALAADREQRYSTARELQEELEEYCAQIGAANRPRELARFVSGLFADTRAELTARIERELSLRDRGRAGATTGVSRSVVRDIAEAQQPVSSTQTISASTANASEGRSANRRLPWFLGVGLLGLALSLYGLTPDSPRGELSAASASALPSALARQSEPVTPTSVKMELSALPSGAQLYLDGELVAENPALRVLPSDGRVHLLRAELAGYQAASAEFTATRDDRVELSLEALKTAVSASSISRARPPRPATKGASLGKPNCAQPFFVDSDGIKKIKRDCL